MRAIESSPTPASPQRSRKNRTKLLGVLVLLLLLLGLTFTSVSRFFWTPTPETTDDRSNAQVQVIETTTDAQLSNQQKLIASLQNQVTSLNGMVTQLQETVQTLQEKETILQEVAHDVEPATITHDLYNAYENLEYYDHIDDPATTSLLTRGEISSGYLAKSTTLVELSTVNGDGLSSGKILKWNGSEWVVSDDADTNTTYTASNGLTLTGTTFKLGGTLTAATALDLDGFAFTFTDGDVTVDDTLYATALYQNGNEVCDISGNCGSGSVFSLTLAGDSGTSQTINNTDTITIAGGSGLTSVASATDTVTINVGAGAGISVGTDTVAVDQSYAFSWTGAQSWSNTADFNGDLTFADTDIVFDGASTNFSTTGNFSINSNDLFIQKSDGNVGIGTTSPGYALDVAGSIGTNDDIYISGIGLNDTASNTTSGAYLIGVFDEFTNSSSTSVQGVLADLDAAIAGSGHDPVTLAGAYDYLTLSAQQITLGQIDLATDVTGLLPLTNGGTNADLSGVSNGGLIYKGATGLAGSGSLTGVLKGNGSSAPTAMTGTANYVTRWSDANSLGTGVLYDDATNVGIGTTVPGAKFDVVGGSIRADGDVSAGDLYLGYDDASATISTADTNENLTIDPNGTGLIYLHGATYYIDSTGLIYSSGLATTGYTPTAGELRADIFRDGNSSYYIQPGDVTTSGIFAGNIGIGTISPDFALQVNGVIAPESTDLDLGTTSLRWNLFANTINADNTVTLTGLGTGTDNTVLILNSSNQVTTDEIDPRVWGSTLIDGAGTTGYVTYWSDANTVTAEQYLSVTRGGLGGNVTAAGAGEILYSTGTSSYDSLVAGTSGYVLTSGGAGAPSWTDPASLGTNYWSRVAGNISPATENDTLSATSSASTVATFTATSSNNAARIGGTASYLTINSSGNLAFTNASGSTIDSSASLTIGGSTQTGLILGRSGVSTRVANLTSDGVVYTSGSNGTLNTEAQLAISRGGTNGSATPTAGAVAYGTGTAYAFSLAGTSGQAFLSGGAGTPTWGTLGLTYGGTNADLSAVATGGLIYKDASALAGTGALTGVLKGNGSSAPTAMTGTTNYLTKWSDANTLGVSVMFDDGTNIGIGTNTPDFALQVNGVIAPETTAQDLGTSSLRWDLFATNIDADGTITLSGLSSDTDDTILILNASNQVKTRDIDPRVWSSSLVDGSGTAGYVAYWTDTDQISAEQYLSVIRGGLGNNLTAVGAGEILYSTGTSSYDSLPAGSNGYILSSGGAGAPVWVDPSTLGTNYWQKVAGVLSPLLSEPLAATSSATTVATFTSTGSNLAAQIGGESAYLAISNAGNLYLVNTLGSSIDASGGLTIGGSSQTGLTLGRSGVSTKVANLTTDGVVYTSGTDGTLNSEAQLAISRGGTNGTATPTAGAIAYGTGTAYAFSSAGTIGQAFLSGGTGTPTWGTLGLTYGGTNADLSAVATGGIIYKGASALAGSGALTGVIKGNGSSAPTAMTGTTNYLTKWSDANTLSTSIMYDDGTNIGIGTNTPDFALQVNGVIAPETTAQDLGTTSLRWDLFASNINASGTVTLGGLTASRAVFTDGSSNLTSSGTSAYLLSSLTDETGTGVAVFNDSPEIANALTTASSTFNLLNTTATTINFGGAASTLNIGPGSSTATSVNIAGGSGATGCTVDGATGNLTCTGTISGSNTNLWQYANGAISPTSPYTNNADVLIGSNATASAKFAILNVFPGSGTPTASVSTGLSGTSAFLTAGGKLGTSNRMTLQIGNSSGFDTTGNILLHSNGTGNVGIGTTNANAKLAIVGNSDAIQFILKANATQSNANPLMQFQDSTGAQLFGLHSDDARNIFLGRNPGYNNDSGGGGINNTFIGSNAGYENTTGANNTALGTNALDGDSGGIIGSYNTAIGGSALSGIGAGGNNTALGYNAAQGILDGGNNVALGDNSLLVNISGSENVVIGSSAVGSVSGANNLNKSVIIGSGAGYNLANTGDNNILLGYAAGNNLTTGNTNILIGYDIDAPSVSSSQVLSLGNLIYGTGLDGTGTTISSGNVGIGTNNPSSFKLQVAGSVGPQTDDTYDLGSNAARWKDLYLGGDTLHIGTSTTDEGTISYNTTSNILGISTDSTTNGDIAFFTDDLYLDKSAGNIGIGSTSPSQALDVVGNVHISGLTASLPVKTDASKNLVSGAINLASAEVTGILGLSNGGTNADLSGASTGGLIYKGASALAASGSLTGVLKGNGSSAPTAMTGTSDYVTRWTDANTLGTGVLYDNGTNVGISTTTPSSFKLEIAGSIGPTANNTYNLGSDTRRWANVYATAFYQAGNTVCDTSGNCSAIGNYWQYGNGALSPSTPYTNNSDLLIGSNASDSAKFAVLNVFPGSPKSPSASVSSGLSGTAIYLTADGTLATENRSNLTIGNSSSYDTSGNVLINPNGTGNIGIGTTVPGNKLDVTGTGRFSSTLTASNGLTQTTGALNLTATSGTLTLSGMSASSMNFGANNLTVTAGNFNTTATGINSTAIGATTRSTAAFTTLAANNTVTFSSLGAGATNTVVTHSSGVLQTRTIDSRVWGSSIVDGSGTANYMTKWSDADTITNGLLYDNGTNIIMNDTAISRSTGAGLFHIESDVTTTIAQFWQNTADANGPNIILGKTRGSIDSNTVVQSGDSLGRILFYGGDGGVNTPSAGAAIEALVDATPGNSDMPGSLVFYTSPDGTGTLTERLKIRNNGNVGIGPGTPAALFDINTTVIGPQQIIQSSNVWAGISLRSETDGGGAGTQNWQIVSGAGGSTKNFALEDVTGGGTSSNAPFQIEAGSSVNALWLDNTSNVGIGSTSPGAKLDVTGRIMQSGAAGITNYMHTNSGLLSSTTNLNPGILVFGPPAGTASNYYGMDLGYANSRYRTRMFGPDNQDISFAFHTGGTAPTAQSSFTDAMTIRGDSGNVGIGTTTPTLKLHVEHANTTAYSGSSISGDGMFIRNLNSSSTGGTLSQLKFQVSSNNGAHNALGAINLIQPTNGSHDSNFAFQLRSSAGTYSEVMRMLANGNVGIGTTNPDSALQVSGKGHINNVYIGGPPTGGTPNYASYTDSVVGNTNLWLSSRTGGNLYLNGLASSGNVYALAGGGNFGIGSTSAAKKLDVYGAIRVDNNDDEVALVFEDSGGDDTIFHTVNDGQGNYNIMLGVNGDGNRVVTGDGISKMLFTGHSGGGEISLNAGATGTAGASGTFNIGLSLDSDDQMLRIGNPGDNVGLDAGAGNIIADVNGYLYSSRYLYHTGDTNTYLDFPSNDTISMTTSGTERLTIDSGGNVGIGTSSGSVTKLSVKQTSNAGGIFRAGYFELANTIANASSQDTRALEVNATNTGSDSGGGEVWGVMASASNTQSNTASVFWTTYGVRGSATGNTNGVSTSRGIWCLSSGSDTNECGGNQAWTNTSDARVKTNVSTIQNSLQIINSLRGVRFQRTDDGSDRVQVGFIAQEVLPYLPEVVHHDAKTDLYSLEYGSFTPLLVNAMQEQQTQIDTLKTSTNKLSFNSAGELTITGSSTAYTVTPVSGSPLTNILGASQAVIGKLTTGMVTTKELVVQQSATIADLSVNSLTISGQSLTSYIQNIVQIELKKQPTPLPQDAIAQNFNSGMVINNYNTTVTIIQSPDASTSATTSFTATGSGEIANYFNVMEVTEVKPDERVSILASLITWTETAANGLRTMIFNAPTQFRYLAWFQGPVKVNADTSGVIVIPANTLKARVSFSKPFPEIPTVYVNFSGNTPVSHTISDVNQSGFTINFITAPVSDVSIQWLAVIRDESETGPSLEVMETGATIPVTTPQPATTPSPTSTPTPQPSANPTPTATPTPGSTGLGTLVNTPPATGSATPQPTSTATPSPTPIATPTATQSAQTP